MKNCFARFRLWFHCLGNKGHYQQTSRFIQADGKWWYTLIKCSCGTSFYRKPNPTYIEDRLTGRSSGEWIPTWKDYPVMIEGFCMLRVPHNADHEAVKAALRNVRPPKATFHE